jgi:hypothetical protein
MNCRFRPLYLAAALAFLAANGQACDDKKTDGDYKVPEGTEFSLTPVDVKPSEKPDEMGRFEAVLKPAKEPAKVKMPKDRYTLGFYPKDSKVKGGGVAIDSGFEGLGLMSMRTTRGDGGTQGPWSVDPGDVITHVNGYAVNTVEEILCATSLAKDKDDVQIVIKDVNTGLPNIFYVTATKP